MICGLQSETMSAGIGITDLIQEFTLGCCTNGLIMISKTLIDPAVNASSLHRYYVRFDRILELPVNSEGLIEACDVAKRLKYAAIFDYMNHSSIDHATIDDKNETFKDVR